MADVVIVGGGIGGLVAARRLALNGLTVTLLEASDRLGGTVGSHIVGGLRLDAGAESFARRGGTVETLLRSLGLGDDIVEPNPIGAWLQTASGQAHRLPELSLLGIPGSPLASDVTAIIGYPAAWRAYIETMFPGPYGSRAATLGELVRKRMGDVVLEQLVAPIVRGVHSSEPDELPVAAAAPGLRETMLRVGSLAGAVRELRGSTARAGSAVAGIRGGVSRIVDALETELHRFGVEVRLNTRVTAAASDHVSTDAGELYGRVVVAAPGICGDPGTARKVILATLVVDDERLDAAPRGTGVLVAKGAPGIRAKALTHATAKWQWLADAADGRHVLRLSYDEADDAGSELAQVALRDASGLTGIPFSASGLVDFARVEWFRHDKESHAPSGILVVGETTAGTGLANVIAQAEALASTLT